jgi:hypothetical protein
VFPFRHPDCPKSRDGKRTRQPSRETLFPHTTPPSLPPANTMSAFLAGSPVVAKVTATPVVKRDVTVRAAAPSECVPSADASIPRRATMAFSSPERRRKPKRRRLPAPHTITPTDLSPYRSSLRENRGVTRRAAVAGVLAFFASSAVAQPVRARLATVAIQTRALHPVSDSRDPKSRNTPLLEIRCFAFSDRAFVSCFQAKAILELLVLGAALTFVRNPKYTGQRRDQARPRQGCRRRVFPLRRLHQQVRRFRIRRLQGASRVPQGPASRDPQSLRTGVAPWPVIDSGELGRKRETPSAAPTFRPSTRASVGNEDEEVDGRRRAETRRVNDDPRFASCSVGRAARLRDFKEKGIY